MEASHLRSPFGGHARRNIDRQRPLKQGNAATGRNRGKRLKICNYNREMVTTCDVKTPRDGPQSARKRATERQEDNKNATKVKKREGKKEQAVRSRWRLAVLGDDSEC